MVVLWAIVGGIQRNSAGPIMITLPINSDLILSYESSQSVSMTLQSSLNTQVQSCLTVFFSISPRYTSLKLIYMLLLHVLNENNLYIYTGKKRNVWIFLLLLYLRLHQGSFQHQIVLLGGNFKTYLFQCRCSKICFEVDQMENPQEAHTQNTNYSVIFKNIFLGSYKILIMRNQNLNFACRAVHQILRIKKSYCLFSVVVYCCQIKLMKQKRMKKMTWCEAL